VFGRSASRSPSLSVLYACATKPQGVDTNPAALAAAEIGIDDFQASRSPDKKFYRTTPLKGLFVRAKGGFYHDGRFEDYKAVVSHYNRVLSLSLSAQDTADLVEYLKSL